MSNNESPKYFDLHTSGIGYLNRVREVTPKEEIGRASCRERV